MDDWARVIKLIGIFSVAMLVGVLVMSILGASDFSLHIISLTNGWAGRLWDFLWCGLIAGTFFILGGFCRKVLGESEKDEK